MISWLLLHRLALTLSFVLSVSLQLHLLLSFGRSLRTRYGTSWVAFSVLRRPVPYIAVLTVLGKNGRACHAYRWNQYMNHVAQKTRRPSRSQTTAVLRICKYADLSRSTGNPRMNSYEEAHNLAICPKCYQAKHAWVIDYRNTNTAASPQVHRLGLQSSSSSKTTNCYRNKKRSQPNHYNNNNHVHPKLLYVSSVGRVVQQLFRKAGHISNSI